MTLKNRGCGAGGFYGRGEMKINKTKRERGSNKILGARKKREKKKNRNFGGRGGNDSWGI